MRRSLLGLSGLLLAALVLAGCDNADDAVTPAADAPAAAADAAPPAMAAAPAAVTEAPPPAMAAVPAAGEGLAAATPGAVTDPALENTLYVELRCGRVTIAMRPDLAPLHVERIKLLARQGFYDGIVFHRVIDGFMAQTGDPTGTGGGGAPLPDLRAEFNTEPFVRGTVGMARTNQPNTANSQFFIMFARYPSLDRNYTVWGQVTDGMECVDQLVRGEPPANPDRMLTVRVAADIR